MKQPFPNSSPLLELLPAAATLIECCSEVHEVGEHEPLCCPSEQTTDKTEVGEPVSFSMLEQIGERDLSDWYEFELCLGPRDLRGYGWTGFLLGRGGGISIGEIEPSGFPFKPRATWRSLTRKRKFYNQESVKGKKWHTMRISNTTTFKILHADKYIIFTCRKGHFSSLNLWKKLLGMASNLNWCLCAHMLCT